MEVRRKTKDNTIYILYALIQCRPLGHLHSIVRLLAGHHLRIPLGIKNLQILFLLIPKLLPLRPTARGSSTSFCHSSNSAWSGVLKYKAALADFEQ